MKHIETPEFGVETEEASWWFNNQDVIADAFAEERDARFVPVNTTDLDLARAQAEQAGLTTQDYLNQLVHNALHAEAA